MKVQTPKVKAICTTLLSAAALQKTGNGERVIYENGLYKLLNAAAFELWLEDRPLRKETQ